MGSTTDWAGVVPLRAGNSALHYTTSARHYISNNFGASICEYLEIQRSSKENQRINQRMVESANHSIN